MVNFESYDQKSWEIYRHVLSGLTYIHSQGLIHRDLKPSNIFLNFGYNHNIVVLICVYRGTAKIGDFGLATIRDGTYHRTDILSQQEELSQTTLTSEIGTPIYSAPEILKKRKYSYKVDIFSLGIWYFTFDSKLFSSFFEMLYNFQTSMERSVVLRDLRIGSFPIDLDKEKLSSQISIIKSITQLDPKGYFKFSIQFQLLRSSNSERGTF